MNRLGNFLLLLRNLAWEAVRSGWSTALAILFPRHRVHPGFARLAYAELGEGGVALLALLVTLTPGTTCVSVDEEKHELLLHLLDVDLAESTLADIRRDFLAPLQAMYGARA
ncbi:MAG: Na+/H+ antiporter subunit E [Thiobacillus sp.]|nr:Na+/H+ antiporter subunit E [Thiobacillus sp.]